MELDQLFQNSYQSEETAHIQPFDMETLGHAFQLRETAPVELPSAEKGTPTTSGKSKIKSKDRVKKHKKHIEKDKDKGKEKEQRKYKHRHKDRSKDKDKDKGKDKEKKKDKNGNHDLGCCHSKKHEKATSLILFVIYISRIE
uniref:Mediator of RNA polymerase II transcription subunit 19a n=1 Tax=Arundo donax TaxID=35708 RepID=A0A0A9FDF5_ARUDO